ncbi:MAG: site-2 protease family protein [Planctomycetota bacterium]
MLIDLVNQAWNLLLIMAGFGLVVFIHELGHFLAARWAGIRVHAFAIGFFGAICSYRKGMGLRMGSSEAEYQQLLKNTNDGSSPTDSSTISPTEYRLNWFPLGGYVKMLGQEDLDPAATSNLPDSYTAKPVWKRMVVISAGVIMNIILGAFLFMAVYLAGKPESPAVVGDVLPGEPAAIAGLMPGDTIEAINGAPITTFEELFVASALCPPAGELELRVRGFGSDESRLVTVDPTKNDSGLQQIGVFPAASVRLPDARRDRDRAALRTALDATGFAGVPLGSTLTAVNTHPIEPITVLDGQPLVIAHPLRVALETSTDGRATAGFTAPGGETVDIDLTAHPELLEEPLDDDDAPFAALEHLLGIAPLMTVLLTQDAGEQAGLRAGDTFLRVGDADFPSREQAVEQIQARAGALVPIVIDRAGERLELRPPVDQNGRVGFQIGTAWTSPHVAVQPAGVVGDRGPLAELIAPGTRISAVNNQHTPDVRTLARTIAALARDADGTPLELRLAIEPPPTPTPTDTATDALDAELITVVVPGGLTSELGALGWQADGLLAGFELAQATVKADTPWHALVLGVDKTRRWLARTYLTFARLADGGASTRTLRGPVGIAALGSAVAEQGWVELAFFLGLISVNLAVINFLPLPILDGGQFVMLMYEGATRRPVPIAVQSALTLAGLALIAAIFIFVTANDVGRLLSGQL